MKTIPMLTLERLNRVVQVAMGWDDSHLHEFRIGYQNFGKSDPSERWLGRTRVKFQSRLMIHCSVSVVIACQRRPHK